MFRVVSLATLLTFMPSSIGVWNFFPDAFAEPKPLNEQLLEQIGDTAPTKLDHESLKRVMGTFPDHPAVDRRTELPEPAALRIHWGYIGDSRYY